MVIDDSDAIRRALAMLKNRGVLLTPQATSGLKFMGIIATVGEIGISAVGLPVFLLFILEEAIQAAGFGVFTLIQGKLWREASVQNQYYFNLAAQLEAKSSYLMELYTVEGVVTRLVDLLTIGPRAPTREQVAEFIPDEVGKLGFSFMFEPFLKFAQASIKNSQSYSARIDAEIGRFNFEYKQKLDELNKSFADDKFKLQQSHDERLDALSIEKKVKLDILTIDVKQEMQKVASQLRQKEITRSEADNIRIFISQEKDKVEIQLKQEYDEKQRAEKEVHRNGLDTLEKIHINKLEELRHQFYKIDVTDDELTVGVPPVAPLPPPLPPPPTEVRFSIWVVDKNLNGINSVEVFIDDVKYLTANGGKIDIGIPFGKTVITQINAPAGMLISPGGVPSVSFTHTFTENYATQFELMPAPAIPPPPLPLPNDLDLMQGPAHNVEFGFLNPPSPLGSPPAAADVVIIPKRTFTLAEVSNTSQEILAVRLNITSAFTNTEEMNIDYYLTRTDNSVLVTPDTAGELLPTPQSRGFDHWNWAKFAAVWNGVGGDLTGKGVYKLDITQKAGGVLPGTYTLYFEVT